MRVTMGHLEAKALQISEAAGLDIEISRAYGGFSAVEVLKNGGQRSLFNRGHMPTKELAGLMDAYIAGYRAGRGVVVF